MQSISGGLLLPFNSCNCVLHMVCRSALSFCYSQLLAVPSNPNERPEKMGACHERVESFFGFAPFAVVLFDSIGRSSTTNAYCTMHTHTQTYASWKMPYNLLFIFSPTLPYLFASAFQLFMHFPINSHWMADGGTMGTRTFMARIKNCWPLWAWRILQADDTHLLYTHTQYTWKRIGKEETSSALRGEGLLHTIRWPLSTQKNCTVHTTGRSISTDIQFLPSNSLSNALAWNVQCAMCNGILWYCDTHSIRNVRMHLISHFWHCSHTHTFRIPLQSTDVDIIIIAVAATKTIYKKCWTSNTKNAMVWKMSGSEWAALRQSGKRDKSKSRQPEEQYNKPK